MSNPLQIQVNPEILQQRIETIIIQPRFCNDDSSTGSGGSCQFVLPHRGYLSGDSRIILPATSGPKPSNAATVAPTLVPFESLI